MWILLTNYSYMLKKDLKGGILSKRYSKPELLPVLIAGLPQFYVAGPKDESFDLKIYSHKMKNFKSVFSLLYSPFNLSNHNIYAFF